MKVLSLRCSRPVHKDSFKDYGGVQGMDAALLYGIEHVEFAIEQAESAFSRGENISTDLFVEVIVRASGQRQIKKAFEMFGLNDSREIVLFGDPIPRELLESIGAEEFKIEIGPEKLVMLREAFSIKDVEIKAVSDSPVEGVKDLINERIALVSTL